MKISVIICQSTLYEKSQKMPFFRPSDPLVRKVPLNLGSKLEYYLTKSRRIRPERALSYQPRVTP